ADVREQKAEALGEVNQMLAQSVTYFRANQGDVTAAVAEQHGTDEEFLDWWWERHDLLFGEAATEFQRELVAVWDAAIALADLQTRPALDTVLFSDDTDELEETADGERITVSVAVQDDVAHRAALYAIDQSIVTSDTVDLDVTYLPLASLIEAAPAKQYDVIEATPLAVAQGADQQLDFIVLSGGLESSDGTLLLVRRGPPGG
ncbi:MAG: hypothetical protein U1B78_03180, partial [Dehalococcoidia bacterium]|nr:hypothetical protein [Dehalococcoidia bacterium]